MSWANWGDTMAFMLDYKADKSRERIEFEQARIAKQHNELMARLHREAKPKPVTRNAHKCPGCGSHEFKLHDGRSVCVYCRTSQSVAAPVWIDGAGMIP